MTLGNFLDNPEELAIGALFGLATAFIAWPAGLLAVVPCSLLWRLGGAKGGNKLFRRLGVPWTMSLVLFLGTHSLWSIFPFVAMWGPLSLGYGIPCPDDKGSKLGAFFYELTNSNEKLADILTRAVIGMLCALTLVGFVTVNFSGTLAASVFIVVGFPLLTVLI